MANYHCMPTLIWVPFNRSPFWHSVKISAIAKTLKNRRYLFYANTCRIQLTTFWLIILLTVWGQNCSRWTACGLKGNQTSETAAVRNTSQMGIFSWSQNWLTKNLINRAQPATSRNLDSLKKSDNAKSLKPTLPTRWPRHEPRAVLIGQVFVLFKRNSCGRVFESPPKPPALDSKQPSHHKMFTH